MTQNTTGITAMDVLRARDEADRIKAELTDYVGKKIDMDVNLPIMACCLIESGIAVAIGTGLEKGAIKKLLAKLLVAAQIDVSRARRAAGTMQ